MDASTKEWYIHKAELGMTVVHTDVNVWTVLPANIDVQTGNVDIFKMLNQNTK